jgi:hypothetical protein
VPFDSATGRLYGTPVVVVPGIAAGGGYLVAQNAVIVNNDNTGVMTRWSDTAVTVADSTHGYSDFEANQVRLRTELRYALSVPQPLGVVAVDLAA